MSASIPLPADYVSPDKVVRDGPVTYTAAEVSLFAGVGYEAMRIFREKVTGIHDLKSWDFVDAETRSTYLLIAKLVLVAEIHDPDQIHRARVGARQAEGWKWGETYDAAAKTDPDLIAWRALPKERQAEEAIFAGYVHGCRRLKDR